MSKASKKSARKTAKVTGIARNKPRLWSRWSATEKATLRTMVRQGASNKEIQTALKRSMASVARYATPFRKALRAKRG